MNKEELKQQATNTADINNIKEDITFIRKQVSNDLPHQIKALDKRIDKIDVQLGQLIVKMGVVVAVITFTIQKFVN